ncbi:MAG: serine/threonine protein kinase [Myxococcota bacterium]|nr:serine/threonine protein kinase [Myxococcota bacterium]
MKFIHGKTSIGRYELMFALDMGGMAAVYAGRLAGPAGFEKLVALKIVYPHLAAEESFINMFLDEARIVAGIRHPNVAEIYEVGQDDGVYFMAMELIEGHSLHAVARRVRERESSVSAELYADLVAKVCRGAHDAHELCDADGRSINLVHRDISPRNVVISYKGAVKLIDFGVAYAEERLTHTLNGTAKGKVGYMPPEYIRGEKTDRRGDIFALGVVLYNMLTSTQPYPGSNEGERIDSIINGRVVPPSAIVPDIDPWLEGIVLKAIHCAPEKRYATALEMAEELENYVRASEAVVGQEQLAALMMQLFEQEAKELQRKIRKYRKRHPKDWETPSVGSPVGSEKSLRERDDSTSTEVLTDSEVMFSEHGTLLERVEEAPRFSKKRKRSWLLAGVAVACLLIGLSAFVLSRQSGPSSGHATRQNVEQLISEARTSAQAKRVVSPPASQVAQTVRIRFDVADVGVRAALDGVPLAQETKDVVLRRDGTTHTIEFTRPGYFPKRITFEAAQDQSFVISLERMPSRSKAGKNGVKMLRNPFE